MYTAIIEIPKGTSRRIHLSNTGSGEFVDLGEIKEIIPVNDGIMPVDYGFLEDTKSPEGDEIDVLIFSKNIFKTGDKVEVKPFGLLKRDDGDDKVLVTDETENIGIWEEVDSNLRQLIFDYFGYGHKILGIENLQSALSLIEESK